MKKNAVIAAAIIAVSLFSSAEAHPGAKLLTTGAGERTAMTAGMSYQDFDGVHLFTGAPHAQNEMLTPLMSAATKTVDITIKTRAPYRSFRTLRTQGFYSETAPASRRFTQGFYSGR